LTRLKLEAASGNRGGDDIAAAVDLAKDQRYAVAWPESAKTRTLLRDWRAWSFPLP